MTNLEKITMLSVYFKCSQLVIARRAYDSSFINKSEYESVAYESNQAYSRKASSGGGDYYRNQSTRIDHRFLLALEAMVREGRTLHSDAYRLTNTNRNTFDTLLMEVRGERK